MSLGFTFKNTKGKYVNKLHGMNLRPCGTVIPTEVFFITYTYFRGLTRALLYACKYISPLLIFLQHKAVIANNCNVH